MTYGLNGLILPYWPQWVESHTNDHQQIGFIFGFSMAIRAVATLVIGLAISRKDRVKRALVMVALFLSIGFVGLWVGGQQVLASLYASALLCGMYYAIVPLIEHVATQRSKVYQWSYGKIRLWGSFAFGVFREATTATKIDWVGIVKKFWPVLAPSLLIQMSHSYYYSFSTILWAVQGIPSVWIGVLWSAGVAAEIVFFLLCKRLLAVMSLSQIMSLATVACIVRWLVLAVTGNLVALVFVQCLHALTFGATFYAAMIFVLRHLTSRQAALAQVIYAMLLSLVGLGLPGVFLGYGYEALGEKNYFIMCMLAFLALLVTNAPNIKKALNAPEED